MGYSSFMSRFLELLHTHMEPTNYDGFYAYLIQSMGPFGALPIGLLLALVGMAGIWLLTFLSGFSIALGTEGPRRSTGCPPLCFLMHAS